MSLTMGICPGEGNSLNFGDIRNVLLNAEEHLDPNVVEQTVRRKATKLLGLTSDGLRNGM
ncbi:hypothetical protein ACFYRD_39285 [Streptomyces hirsutus]|uniref:hypothetical protein n=1 Tax=Streptomyces hirsutus TaxID=35620 RepID=UPI00369DF98B